MEFVEVKEVNDFNYAGDVYDLNVQIDHTYTANKYAVHNSASGSLCNYLLDITEVDPIRHSLLFERFLDITRDDAVDIDVDYMPSVRDDVIQHLIDKYGRDSVSNICTFGISKTKSAIQDVCRVFSIPAHDVLKVTTTLSEIDESHSLKQIEEQHPQLTSLLNSHIENDLRFYIEGLRGAQRNLSIHASGVLVSSNKLTENVALVRAKKNIVTGWQEGSDYRELSDLGYYKFDILGLNHLEILEDARKMVNERHDINIDWSSLDLNDELVFNKTVANKDLYGVFQFETPLARKVISKILPGKFNDLSACSAILRPGPLKMGVDETYANNKNDGTWSAEEIPECIRDILGTTFGCLVFQEQFMQIMHRIGGLSMAETNAFRKVVSKKFGDHDKEVERMKKLDSYKDQFITIASSSENIGDKAKCEEIWQLIVSMASYAFNASHSVSYTYISFRELWLKTYYDLEYSVSLLNNVDLESSSKYMVSMINKGYKLNYPNVNKSQKKFSIFNDEIVWGLSSVVGLPDKIVDNIIEERGSGLYSSVEDLLKRVKISSSALECLIWSGALDEMETNQQADIFGGMLYDIKDRPSMLEYIQVSLLKNKKFEPRSESKIELEKKYLKLSFEEMSSFIDKKSYIKEKTKLDIDSICDCDDDGMYNIFGIVSNLQKKQTTTGKDYTNMSIKDETGSITGVSIWPWKVKSMVIKGKFYYAKVEIKNGFKSLVSFSEVK